MPVLLRTLFLLLLSLPWMTAHANEFILSYWCGPPPGPDMNARYAEVAECHFNYAMIPCNGSTPEQTKAILEACQKHGLKYILYDARLMAKGPQDPAFTTNLDAVLKDYAGHPATGGYFLGDEPGAGAFPMLGAVNQYLLKHDPQHLPFINLYPNYAPLWALGTSNYEEHVEKYLDIVKPKLLSFDHYAILDNGTERPEYFDNLEIIRRQALKHNVPFGDIFLMTPHGSYPNPGEADLRWQANTALAYGATALLYFTYWTPNDGTTGFGNGIIDLKGNRTPHFEMAKKLNAEFLILGKTLIKLTSSAVYHTSPVPSGCKELNTNSPIQVSKGGPLVIGLFHHEDGSSWAMVVNRSVHKPVTSTLRFNEKIGGLRRLNPKDGRLASVKLRQHEVTVQLLAGEAALFKLMPSNTKRLHSPKAGAEMVRN
ncbi:MAG: hypothetical protein JWQ71_207 [Pedosphaera sp.]|nr:hypothetical protein [Pedosphaera sp.]